MLICLAKDRQRRSGQSEIIALIPELCRATGYTDEMRSNFDLTRRMAEVTNVNARQRVDRLQKFNERLRHTSDSMDVLNRWGLTLGNSLVRFAGHQLPATEIKLTDQAIVATGDWSRELRNSHFEVVLENWYVICTERDKRATDDFLSAIKQAVSKMKYLIKWPAGITLLKTGSNHEYVTALEECARRDPQLVLIVLPTNKSDRYEAIKKKACLDRSILTQVVVTKTILPKGGRGNGPNMSVVTKIAVQMGCKLGSAPWKIRMPLSRLLTIGYDISHDTSNKRQSFGALVATLNYNQTKFFSAVSKHEDGVSLSNSFELNVKMAIRAYQDQESYEFHKTGDLPQKIIIYRDGVGEGQLQHVLDYELEPLKSYLEKVYTSRNETLRLAFIVVNKRINTRIFTDNNQNPPAGTVVDDVITLPERYDFFLVPIEARLGTASPTSYNVIYDSIGLPPAKLQELTYKFCCGYYNWCGPIKVPAVVQYASKLSFLCSKHLHSAPPATTNKLENKLYFL